MDKSDGNLPKPPEENDLYVAPVVPSDMTAAVVLLCFFLFFALVISAGVFGVRHLLNERQRGLREQQIVEMKVRREAAARAEVERRAAEAAREAALIEEQRRQAAAEAERTRIQEQSEKERLLAARERDKQQEKAQQVRQMPQKFAQVQLALFRTMPLNEPESHLAPHSDGAGLSWRVHLLPALGLKALYSSFHLNEPWDSEHNKTLIEQMPTVFGPEPQTGLTQIRSFLRLDGDIESLTRVEDIIDGLNETALLFYAGEKHAIPWTRPDSSLAYSPLSAEQPGILKEESLLFTLCGSEAVLSVKNMPPQVLKALISPAGGEHLSRELITGPWDNPTAAFHVRSLASSASHGTSPPLSNDGELSEAHEKLKRISEALMSREQALKVHKDASNPVNNQLSWRVHLLPYLGETELYETFQIHEPWNSEANLPLADKIPVVFQTGISRTRTRFQLLLPHDCPRDPGQLPNAGVISDAADLTTIVYFAAPQRGVTWTKPDIAESPYTSLQTVLGWPESSPVVAATLAGSAVTIPGNLHQTVKAALVSTNKGELFDIESAFANPGQPLKLTVVILPAAPITDMVRLPMLTFDPAILAPATKPTDEARLLPVGLAVFRFNEEFGFGPTRMKSPGGGPSQLSWRVHLLPFLNEKPLYDRFKLHEPWDSEHNRELLEFMPAIFGPGGKAGTCSRLRVLNGRNTLFGRDNNWLSAPDGLYNTIMFVETSDASEQPWTQPDTSLDISSLNFQDLLEDSGEVLAVLGSRQVLKLTRETPAEVFRALATADGREIIDAASVKRWLAHQRGEACLQPQAETKWELDRLKSIVLAMHNFTDTYDRFFPPQQRVINTDTIPLQFSQLSWRVHILPFLQQRALYEQFRLQEPWDSPHNKQLLSSMPDCYRDADDSVDSNTTRFQTITGPGTAFPEVGRSMRFIDMKDGPSQTLAVLQVPQEYAVPWTKPSDVVVDLDDDATLKLLTMIAAPGTKVATFDGAAWRLAQDITTETLRALVTPAGSELIKAQNAFRPN